MGNSHTHTIERVVHVESTAKYDEEREKHKDDLKVELDNIKADLPKLQDELKETDEHWETIKAEIASEMESIRNFRVERELSNVKLFIALGITGSGKSTFLNRLLGDTSRRGNEGHFGVGSTIRSETSRINKKVTNEGSFNLCLVDTPGAGDSENRDTTFANQLVLYLRGCGGISMFGIFFDLAAARFHEPFQVLLRKYEDLLGPGFWKHCVIIATKADAVEPEDLPNITNQIRGAIVERMDLEEKDAELPVITVGKGQDDYTEALEQFKRKICELPKYNCEAIKSPIDELQEKEQKLESNHDRLSDVLQKKMNRKSFLEAELSKD